MRKTRQTLLKPEQLKITIANCICLGILVFTGYITTAQATLGGNNASVESNRANMNIKQAVRKSLSTTGSYTVHESVLPSGTQIRQFVSTNDVVFAVTWNGPFIPDLRELLGLHFDTMVASQSKQTIAGHRSFTQHEADLVIESGGHMGSFSGRAYLKSAIPAGVSEQEIQ